MQKPGKSAIVRRFFLIAHIRCAFLSPMFAARFYRFGELLIAAAFSAAAVCLCARVEIRFGRVLLERVDRDVCC